MVDFKYLKKVASDSVAWLYQPDTAINQPVMYGDEPLNYLRKQFNKHINPNGSLYMNEDVQDFSAASITIYGRNCSDNSMFGSLSCYQEDEYYRKNPTLYLLTPQGDYQLDIFAGIRASYSDDKTWRVSQRSTYGFISKNLPAILESSFIKPIDALLPQEGDAWAVLATESQQNRGSRYVLYARKRPIEYDGAKNVYVNKQEMDSRQTTSRRFSVKGVGEWMSYAQNDPIWDRLVFEANKSSRRRTFGDGGCGPTAAATAIANIVGKDELAKLGFFANSSLSYSFCSCSVNEYYCKLPHLQYQLTTPDEYARYLPIAVAGFATGNNIWGVQGRLDRYGTHMEYLAKLCAVFGISVEQTSSMDEALEFIKGGSTIAIACTSGYYSPFTNTGHFVVLAGKDEEYLYVLDPLMRDSYKTWDKHEYLDILTPGLVRIKLENAAKCAMRSIYLMRREARP